MDYEKKYKDALGWMQSLYDGLHGATKEDAEHYFPELKESEDEKIRKVFIELVKCNERSGWKSFNNVPTSSMLAWLEKQCETKPANEMISLLRTEYEKGRADAIAEMQKPAWSAEDEVGFGDALWAIEQARTIAKDENDMGNLWYAEKWLKSIKDRIQL